MWEISTMKGGGQEPTQAEATEKKRGAKSKRKKTQNQDQNASQVHFTHTERLEYRNMLTDFLNGDEPELVFRGLTNGQRMFLHKAAASMNLLSRSYGKPDSRVLHIRRRCRNEFLGEEHKLQLPAPCRRLLGSLRTSIEKDLGLAMGLLVKERHRNQQREYSRLRGEALLLELGARLVPPRANRISPELFRDKQELPIFKYQDEVNKMLQKHSIFIVNGETGSGKTTQVPQYILKEATRQNRPCRVIVTQPRRMAAVSVAHRVAEERGEQLGDTVGYQIRMECRVRKTTNLIYTTSGCLLRSIMADAKDLFRKITHLIIDEIHERDKYSDFTLITVKEQLKRNKDLKVILMSATMDINLLSKYFDDCPVLNVPGQGFDVKIYHLEDILHRSGYRTALMDKYLRSLNELQPVQSPVVLTGGNGELSNGLTAAVRLNDEYLQEMLDTILDVCCDMSRSDEEIAEQFDQIQYYIECEGMHVDAGHSKTGITSLMVACKRNFPKYVEYFMQRHASVLVRDAQGLCAFDYSRVHVDGQCTHILQSSGYAMQQRAQLSKEALEKQRILEAYHCQFKDDNDIDHDLILSLLEGLYRSPHPGAIMVFLPGYNDIVQQRDLIQTTLPTGTYRICILHGQMDSQDQFEALQRHHVRKIILSTNIGQTSITIPDLAYIIDSGKVKMKTYDSITESSQLQSVWISKADANQRSGRAGRTQNGICYRLYSTTTYEYMPQFCVPEFMRIPLTEICLYAKTLEKTCDVQSYLSRALNPPSSISVHNAIKKLQILQIFNDDESVTQLGKHLVEIPLDVHLGKCLVYSVFLKCVEPILTIVAFHSVKDPFILPTDRAAQGQASFQRKSFSGQTFSDQLGILALYKAYVGVRNNRKRLREFCNKYFLSQSAMEMFCATRRQISDLLIKKFRYVKQGPFFNENWNMVRFCLAAGFYPNIAVVDRSKVTLRSGAEKQLILQRTSALNPPGMKNLKDFINQLPHDFLVFYEKSRVGSKCAINMNTLVSPLIVALKCGRQCLLDEFEAWPTSDDSDDEEENGNDEEEPDEEASNKHKDNNEALQNCMKSLNLAKGEEATALLTLDGWIRFEMPASDAKILLQLRELIETQFELFLHDECEVMHINAANYVQKLLYAMERNST